MTAKSKGPNMSAVSGALLFPAEGSGETAGAARNCLSTRQLQDRVCVCTHFYILGFSFIFLSLLWSENFLSSLSSRRLVFYMHLFQSY